MNKTLITGSLIPLWRDIPSVTSLFNVKICPRLNFHFWSLVDDDGSKFSEKGFLGIVH